MESSVTTILQDLQWPDLQARRQQAKTAMVYKIVNHLVEVDSKTTLIPRPHVHKQIENEDQAQDQID